MKKLIFNTDTWTDVMLGEAHKFCKYIPIQCTDILSNFTFWQYYTQFIGSYNYNKSTAVK